ncbi:MAG: XRE family transcriptional regulator [Clostridiales bacterium]|nr:XRE family transcriptional regulator [Clostridiales bacterium]
MDKSTTDNLMDALMSTDNESQLESFLKRNDGKYPMDFKTFLNAKMEERGVDKPWLIRESRVEKSYIYKLCDGKKCKPGKDKIVMIALALHMSVKETQKALEVVGESALYPKNKRDSILIFAIKKKHSVSAANSLLEHYGEAPLE